MAGRCAEFFVLGLRAAGIGAEAIPFRCNIRCDAAHPVGRHRARCYLLCRLGPQESGHAPRASLTGRAGDAIIAAWRAQGRPAQVAQPLPASSLHQRMAPRITRRRQCKLAGVVAERLAAFQRRDERLLVVDPSASNEGHAARKQRIRQASCAGSDHREPPGLVAASHHAIERIVQQQRAGGYHLGALRKSPGIECHAIAIAVANQLCLQFNHREPGTGRQDPADQGVKRPIIPMWSSGRGFICPMESVLSSGRKPARLNRQRVRALAAANPMVFHSPPSPT